MGYNIIDFQNFNFKIKNKNEFNSKYYFNYLY